MVDQTSPEESVEKSTSTKESVEQRKAKFESIRTEMQEANTQIQIFLQTFGEIGNVGSNGKLYIYNTQTNEGYEYDASELRSLIIDVTKFENEGKEIEQGREIYLANLMSAYAVQRAIEMHPDKVSQDKFGAALSALPPVRGQSNVPVVPFSIFTTADIAEQTKMLDKGFNKIAFESESDADLAKAVQAFDKIVERSASYEGAVTGLNINKDFARHQFLFGKTIVARLSQQQIVDESVNLIRAGYGVEEGRVATLQTGIAQLIAYEEKANPFKGALRAAKGGMIDFEIAAIALNKDGDKVIALDKFTGQIKSYGREDLIELLRTKNKPDLTGIMLSVFAIDSYAKLMAGKDNKSYAVDMQIPRKETLEKVFVAFDTPEEFAKKIEGGHNFTNDNMAPREFSFTKINPEAEATVYFSIFDEVGHKALGNLSTIREEVIAPIRAEFKNDEVLRERLKVFEDNAGTNKPAAGKHFITQFLQDFYTRDISLSNLRDFLGDIQDDKAKHAYWSDVLVDLEGLQAEHDEEVAEYQSEIAKRENITNNILARGAQSDKAYEVWKDIYKLPKAAQAAAQIKAFCPSVANDIPDGTLTQDPDHDFIDLAVTSWSNARRNDVKSALGDLTPAETALMEYSVSAAHDSMRYIVMMELAAYDPTVFMRKEKDIYYKHLDQASKSVYKANGGVDPLTNVERHVYDWRNLYYEEGERGPKQNLVDIVEYRTQEGGADGQTYHHHFTQFYCASDFFNNAKGQAKSSALDYVGLSGVANYFMGKDSPRRMERELVQAIAGNKLESLGIAQDRFDAIIELSTKVANRPVETADIFKGNSLLTGAYVRAHIEATHRRKAQLNSTMKP